MSRCCARFERLVVHTACGDSHVVVHLPAVLAICATVLIASCGGGTGESTQGSAASAAAALTASTSAAQVLTSSITDLVSVNSGQCINVTGSSTASGALIIQAVCDGKSDNTWTVVPVGSNYHLVASNSGQCLNVPGASTKAGTQLIQWPCQASTSLNDQWQLVPVGTYYHIVSASSGLCVNIDDGSQLPGATVIQYTCQAATSLNDQFELYGPSAIATTLPSTWTGVIPLPVTPIGVANLPSGNLMMWSAYAPYTYEGDIGTAASQTYTGVFNPTTQTSTDVLVTSAGSDMFCPGTAVLPSGKLLVNGGSSSPKTTLYDPVANTWTASAAMNIWRGYEADATLSSGDVLTLGGSWSGGDGNKTGELWTSAGSWTVLSGVPETNIVGPDPKGIYRGDNHLWMFGVSNGNVFHAGPSSQMNWITTAQHGTISSAGNRGNDPFSINGNAVMYDIGKILKVGGAPSYDQDATTTTYASASAYTIDISGGPTQPVKLQQVTSMTYRRAFSNGVALPDGTVVVVGGQSIPQPFTDTAAVLTPELWNPATQTFSLLAPMQIPRTYHSTALLLPDARVFVGGGGQCGVGCPNNHLDAQILTPPYLLTTTGAAATRPVIASAPATAALGTSLAVTATGSVSAFAMMRLSATTHTVNNDQRRVPLFTVPLGGSSYSLLVPSDPGIALPGYYMLFALSSAGVPSVAATIQVTAPTVQPPANAVSCATQAGTCTPPAGTTATVWYGAASHWAVIGNVSSAIGCNASVFGDPDQGVVKTCSYALTPPPSAIACGAESQTCTLPANATATVWYGADTHWTAKSGVTGSLACTDQVFGDPEQNAVKACAYQVN